MKKNRHDAILNLIAAENIGTQEELMVKLNELGYKVTQATVSRDIKFLKLIKTPISGGQYKYTYTQNENEDFNGKYFSILAHSVTSIAHAGMTVVVKCHAGMAQAACAALDNLPINQIVGTLAGDDTIFVLCSDENAAVEFEKYVEKTLSYNQN